MSDGYQPKGAGPHFPPRSGTGAKPPSSHLNPTSRELEERKTKALERIATALESIDERLGRIAACEDNGQILVRGCG